MEQVSRHNENRKRMQAFIAEIKLAAQLRLPRVVEFVGAAGTIVAELPALFPYMDGGDLRAQRVLAGDGAFGPPAGLFSFDIVLWELDTHAFPYATVRVSAELAEEALPQLVMTGERRSQLGTTCPLAIAALVDQCLALDRAGDRPSALALAYQSRLLKQRMGASGVGGGSERVGM